jgi:hypothetical protein
MQHEQKLWSDEGDGEGIGEFGEESEQGAQGQIAWPV